MSSGESEFQLVNSNGDSAESESCNHIGHRYAKLLKINFALTLSLLVLLCFGLAYSWGPISQYRNTDPTIDGFVEPRSISALIDMVQNSTVSVFCEFGATGNSDQGTGWAINIETEKESEYPTALVTNHHVIENCLDGKGKLSVSALGGKEFPAIIDNWDEENDIAIIATKLKLKGSVAFGNVLNVTDTEVLITAAISSGNSGGPLVDNEGKVIGINSWSAKKEQYNGAMSLDAMCLSIMQCNGATYWDWSR